MTARDFDYGTYELAGPFVMTVADVARGLGARVETMNSQAWQRQALAGGMAAEAVRRLAAMFEQYDLHGLVGNPAALAMILGRPPANALDALLRDLAAGYRTDD
jgi:predicted xylose isomerase-like sugar epimerase